MVHNIIVSLRRYILVPTTYVIVENIWSVYTDFLCFKDISLTWYYSISGIRVKIVNMVAIFATMVLYFGCPKEPSH